MGQLLYQGPFPPVHDRPVSPAVWLQDYVATYVERDVRGLLFENWAMTELLKAQTNRGLKPSLSFLRDKQGHELDVVIETAPRRLHGVAIKAGETVSSDGFAGLDYWRGQLPNGVALTPWLIYGGGAAQQRERAKVLSWAGLDPILAQLHG